MLQFWLRWIFAFSLTLTALTPSFAASTAKEALKDVTAAAQKWQPDAVLTHISTLMGRGDGKADQWLYTFYSPKAKKSAIVTARDKTVANVEADVRNTSTDPLGGDYVDSDKAVEAATKAGLKLDKGAKGLGMGLVVGNQAVGKPQLFWSVTIMSGDGMSSVLMNGKDAAFIRRNDHKFK
ncbi:MAG TPA: hypothetical protein VGA59_13020 [Ramlibacter sp.]